MDEQRTFNRREYERCALPVAYSHVEARPMSRSAGGCLHGHAYDVSEGGVRIELDEPLPRGEPVMLRLTLPGEQASVAARANVVWVNDELDDPGPRRMALRFKDFTTSSDRERLLRFMGQGLRRVAA